MFYRGEMVNISRSDVGDAWWMDGEAAARAHGYMMLHAAGLASR